MGKKNQAASEPWVQFDYPRSGDLKLRLIKYGWFTV